MTGQECGGFFGLYRLYRMMGTPRRRAIRQAWAYRNFVPTFDDSLRIKEQCDRDYLIASAEYARLSLRIGETLQRKA